MKRNLMAELTEGLDALAAERQGEITLKQHAVEMSSAPIETTEEQVVLHERLNLTR